MNRHLGRGLNAVRHHFDVETTCDVKPLAPTIPSTDASALVGRVIEAGQPAMIARFGANELDATLRRLEMHRPVPTFRKTWSFLRGECGPFWWDDGISKRMHINAGFFPPNHAELSRFGDLMLSDCRQVDVLGSWLPGEAQLAPLMAGARVIKLADLAPYMHEDPWSAHLEGKRVLVIHPFDATIRTQYARRELIFRDPRILPAFDLLTLKAVQSIAGARVPFRSWFDALAWMREQMSELEFDVALIGAGAYGFPLAADAKRLGKIGVHLGGALQILFGIRGRRWDVRADHQMFFNADWVRPSADECVELQNDVEGGCYW
jgi:hypothetical protein